MLPTDYNDFLTECADSALGSIKYHEAQMKYADEQIAYWQQRRQHEQNAWNNAYVDYHYWLKQQGKEPEKARPSWKRIQVVKHYDAPLGTTDEMLAQEAYESLEANSEVSNGQ